MIGISHLRARFRLETDGFRCIFFAKTHPRQFIRLLGDDRLTNPLEQLIPVIRNTQGSGRFMMSQQGPLKLFNLGSAINIIADTQMHQFGR